MRALSTNTNHFDPAISQSAIAVNWKVGHSTDIVHIEYNGLRFFDNR
jgi:hypothetical protein